LCVFPCEDRVAIYAMQSQRCRGVTVEQYTASVIEWAELGGERSEPRGPGSYLKPWFHVKIKLF